MKICYQEHAFNASSAALIDQANEILEDYAEQGYDLTLRQLYYQFVARGIIPNRDTEYKRLGSLINDARLAGLIDWDHITDRTRNLQRNAHWGAPVEIVRAAAEQFQYDKWADQDNYVEVWVEKDALVGVLQVACAPLDVAYCSCRGYSSQSEMWAAGQRLRAQLGRGKRVHIIHLGDHDPSGIDMSRDILDRLKMFLAHHVSVDLCDENPRTDGETTEQWVARLNPIARQRQKRQGLVSVHRIALNMDQIRQYNPPPNPAKITDSRARGYMHTHGGQSWELDALEPAVLTALIQAAVDAPPEWFESRSPRGELKTQNGTSNLESRDVRPHDYEFAKKGGRHGR